MIGRGEFGVYFSLGFSRGGAKSMRMVMWGQATRGVAEGIVVEEGVVHEVAIVVVEGGLKHMRKRS
jgi:hypothetical protein